VHKDWAPLGAQRFLDLVKTGFLNGAKFFRVVPGFMAQFGLPQDPNKNAQWAELRDDSPAKCPSNKRGTVVFATSGPNSRTTQLFINFGDNAFLDAQGFTPFGEVVSGMNLVDQINPEYRETPDQGTIRQQGDAYLSSSFPNLSRIKETCLLPAKSPAMASGMPAAVS